MKIKIDQATCAFGATKILTHLQALEDEISGVRLAEDIECIHRMRVASRRLRSTLPLFHACFPGKKMTAWLSKIKVVTGSLSRARDLDVQLDVLQNFLEETTQKRYQPGIRRIMIRLGQKRDLQQTKVLKMLDQLAGWQLVDELRAAMQQKLDAAVVAQNPTTFPLYYLSYRSISNQLEIMLKHSEAVFDPQNIQELHQMRIEAKRLRYTMETFSAIYPEEFKSFIRNVKDIQEFTGNIHDCDVWCDFLPRFIQKESQRTLDFYGSERPFQFIAPGIKHFFENRRLIRQQLHDAFIIQWKEHQTSSLWDQLLAVISAPIQPVFVSQTPGLKENQPDPIQSQSPKE
jgi:CHAD domain-containing protein